MPITKAQKSLIHVAKARLGMEEADYRALLLRAAGVDSSTRLDQVGFEAAMAEFERLGFQPTAASKPLGGAGPDRPTRKQWGLVAKLAKEKGFTGPDDRHLATLCRKVAKVDHPRFLDRRGMRNLILAMKRWIYWGKTHPGRPKSSDAI